MGEEWVKPDVEVGLCYLPDSLYSHKSLCFRRAGPARNMSA